MYRSSVWVALVKVGQRQNLQLLVVPDHRSVVDTATNECVYHIVGINAVALSRLGSWRHRQKLCRVSALVLGVEHGQENKSLIIDLIGTDHIALALAHGQCLSSRSKAFATLNGKNTTILQHIRIVKQINVVVPLANAINPVVDILDKVDVQGVPLAILPVTDLRIAVLLVCA